MRDDEVWLLLDSSAPGGIESHVLLLAAGLRACGVGTRVVFWKRYGEHPLFAALSDRGVPWLALDGSLGGCIAALRNARPAVLHTHGYKAGILGRLLAPLAGSRVVHTFHAGEPGRGRLRAWHALERIGTVFDHERIAVSAPVAAALPCRSQLIANFVELPAALPPHSGSRRVVFLGRLSEEKGPDLFCRIAERSPQEIPFEVYGDGPMRTALQSRFGERVRFHGFTRDVARVLRSCGLLLMPSRHEGLPLAALEAMGAGVPVAAARVGGLPDLIAHGRSGYLFEPGNVDEAADVVRSWLTAPVVQLDLLRQAAFTTVSTRHGLEHAVQRTLALYRLHPPPGVAEPVLP